jgi:hypothetical protein
MEYEIDNALHEHMSLAIFVGLLGFPLILHAAKS